MSLKTTALTFLGHIAPRYGIPVPQAYPGAVNLIREVLDFPRNSKMTKNLRLNPWFIDLGDLSRMLPSKLAMVKGANLPPFNEQVNFDPRERVIAGYLEGNGRRRSRDNYGHARPRAMMEVGSYRGSLKGHPANSLPRFRR
jgi:hypothetical protein